MTSEPAVTLATASRSAASAAIRSTVPGPQPHRATTPAPAALGGQAKGGPGADRSRSEDDVHGDLLCEHCSHHRPPLRNSQEQCSRSVTMLCMSATDGTDGTASPSAPRSARARVRAELTREILETAR